MAGTTKNLLAWRGVLAAALLAVSVIAASGWRNESGATPFVAAPPGSIGFAPAAPGELLLVQSGAPLRFDYTYESGPYVRKVRGTVRDTAGFARALAALQPPAGAHGGYGMLGDDALLGKEPGYGLRQLGMLARRYLTFETIYVRQPSGFEQYGVQSGTFTKIEQLNDATLGWVLFDLRGKFETDLPAPPPATAAATDAEWVKIINGPDWDAFMVLNKIYVKSTDAGEVDRGVDLLFSYKALVNESGVNGQQLKPVMSSIHRYVFVCDSVDETDAGDKHERLLSDQGGIGYDGKMATGNKLWSWDDPDVAYVPVEPGAWQRFIADLVCGAK